MSLQYGLLESSNEHEALIVILSESFGSTLAEGRGWLERSNPDLSGARVLRDGGEVVAGLVFYEALGQWFGGRRIPCSGIAGVGSSAAGRGKGHGTTLIREAILELHRRGVPLACLYPATIPLYRRAGFELAGARWEIRVAVADLDLKDRELSCRRATDADREAMEKVHRHYGSRTPGQVDRSPALWSRIEKPLGKEAEPYVVHTADGTIEGYLFLRRNPGTSPGSDRMELQVSDLGATTGRAARRLLTFLGDHRSLAGDAFWYGSPADPILSLLRDARIQVRRQFPWMTRIVDVPAALTARGWPKGMSGELHLEVQDDVVRENDGRFVLSVRDGEARVAPGGEGRLRIDVRGLAALFTGYLSPQALTLTGQIEGAEEDLSLAAALFAGPMPTMVDFF